MANDKTKTTSTNLGIDDISVLLQTLEKHEVTEFKLEREGEKVWLKRGPQTPGPVQNYPYQGYPAAAYTGPQVAQASGAATNLAGNPTGVSNSGDGGPNLTLIPGSSAAVDKNQKEVRSPMVGTFYRRAAVDAEAYVAVGDLVKKGDVLCIIEAMKLMNEIESEVSGRVSEICLEDGQMVEYGEVLFKVEAA